MANLKPSYIATEKVIAAASEFLGEELSSMRVMLDGVGYEFPMKTQFLLSDGWTPEERLKEELDPFPAYSEDVQIKMVKSKGEEQQEIGLSLLNNLLEKMEVSS